MSLHLKCAYFVQRDDRNALLQLSVLQQVLPDPFILYDDIIEFSTSSDLKCSRLRMVFWLERD